MAFISSMLCFQSSGFWSSCKCRNTYLYFNGRHSTVLVRIDTLRKMVLSMRIDGCESENTQPWCKVGDRLHSSTMMGDILNCAVMTEDVAYPCYCGGRQSRILPWKKWAIVGYPSYSWWACFLIPRMRLSLWVAREHHSGDRHYQQCITYCNWHGSIMCEQFAHVSGWKLVSF